jgi:ABC-2 type transport system ATP-binding protein
MSVQNMTHQLSKISGLDSRNVAIEMLGITKRFYVYEHRSSSLREYFIDSISRRSTNVSQSYFSLHELSLSLNASETWALIGPNGSGKSTLLRLIAGIYWPTNGQVITRGRLAALIDFTAGFHPELTGQENVYLYGSILGFSDNDLLSRYKEIVKFAGLENFMNTPIKYYSSGMRMRLGFSVATAVKPDILLLDEVFAIGDAEFHDQCLERLRTFQNRGCTLVIATHDLDTAAAFATHAIWLDRGQVQQQGTADTVIAAYKGSFKS